ncbi:MAG: HAMP domain-containing histidine kinase [Gemmatimonadota bacterium]|nr:HAMP domain-containing histidine kinase [Gemmatimonadota bacterium]
MAFVGTALALLATLGWLGWRLLEQERDLAGARARAQLEVAADLITASLTRGLTETEAELGRIASMPADSLEAAAARYARTLGEDAALVVFASTGIVGYPVGRLLYHPDQAEEPDPPLAVFESAERLEFQKRDYAAAAERYRELARTGNPDQRAGAMLRLGRVLRRSGQLVPTLAAYAEMERMGPLHVAGAPADLVARSARLAVLESGGRIEESRRAADSLLTDLYGGRWRLTRSTFEFYRTEIAARSTKGEWADSVHRVRSGIATGAEALRDRWLDDAGTSRTGHRVSFASSGGLVVLWQKDVERLVGIVAGPAHITSSWLAEGNAVLQRNGARLHLADGEGVALLGASPPTRLPRAVRTPAESHLPWTIQVASVGTGPGALRGDQARLLIATLAVTMALVLFSAYAASRAVARELRTARLQSDFVAAVSHEFRTPLTSMRQLMEMLSTGRVTDAARRDHYYMVLQRESARLHRLVEGLLDFARMEANALEYRRAPLDLSSLVTEVVAAFRAELQDARHTVVVSANEETLSRVNGDREALSRALWNLLDNAIKYSPDGGEVRVDVSNGAGSISIAVRDRGIGVGNNERERIFDKFVRGREAERRGSKGTGIGLAMVKHIAEGHGGSVHVSSEGFGRGSTFTIDLPAANSL